MIFPHSLLFIHASVFYFIFTLLSNIFLILFFLLLTFFHLLTLCSISASSESLPNSFFLLMIFYIAWALEFWQSSFIYMKFIEYHLSFFLGFSTVFPSQPLDDLASNCYDIIPIYVFRFLRDSSVFLLVVSYARCMFLIFSCVYYTY